jgi:hypothetical protein
MTDSITVVYNPSHNRRDLVLKIDPIQVKDEIFQVNEKRSQEEQLKSHLQELEQRYRILDPHFLQSSESLRNFSRCQFDASVTKIVCHLKIQRTNLEAIRDNLEKNYQKRKANQLRMEKILRFKQKRAKYRETHTISREYPGRSKAANEKRRINGKFISKRDLKLESN